MTGWQRFFLVFAVCALVLICWPQYNEQGLSFMLFAFVLWVCIGILLSVLINLFAIYKIEFLHRLVSLLFLAALIISLLYYFPLKDKETPLLRLQKNQWPTSQDIQLGIKRLTFHFDFKHPKLPRDLEQINQKIDKTISDNTKKAKRLMKEPQEDDLDVVLDIQGDEE